MAEPFSTVRLADLSRMDKVPAFDEFEQFMIEFHQLHTRWHDGGRGVPIETSRELARKEISLLHDRGARTLLDRHKRYTPGVLPPWPVLLWHNGVLDKYGSGGVYSELMSQRLPREATAAFKAARSVAMTQRHAEKEHIKAEREERAASRVSKKSAEKMAGLREGRIGECAVCGRFQKTNPKGAIAHHGYTRPEGWFVGTCIGSREDHYGKSAKACHKYLAVLDVAEFREKGTLQALKTAETIEVPKGYRGRETRTIRRSDIDFEARRKHLVAKVEGNLRSIAKDRALMHERIRDWKPQDPAEVRESVYKFDGLLEKVVGGERISEVVGVVAERYQGAVRERVIMYHGTSARLAQKILTQGLIPNPDKRAWADDPHVSFNQSSRVSYGGIYLTRNLMTAMLSDKATAGRSEDRVIFILEVQPRSLIADEDDFAWLRSLVPNEGYLINEYIVMELWIAHAGKAESPKQFVREHQDRYIEGKLEQIRWHFRKEWSEKHVELHPKLEARIRVLLEDLFPLALQRAAAHAFKNDDRFSSPRVKAEKAGIEIPEVSRSEREFAHGVDKMTRTVKDVARAVKNPTSFNRSGRSMTPITTRSKGNRIVGAVQVHELGTQNEHGNHRKLTLLYGKLPSDFIEQWTERIGDGYFTGNRVREA
jgi:hypothetical protein